MEIELFYGKDGLRAEVPDGNLSHIYRKKEMPVAADPDSAVRAALEKPQGTKRLSRIARGKKTACIVVNDITRPVPNALILPHIIRELNEAGIADEDILLLNATGTHRPNEGPEAEELLGAEIASKYRFENHFCFRHEDHRLVGSTRDGTDVFIDKRYLDADVRVLTGLIEPHFMAGYSGGRKALCPGVASIKTIERIHSPRFMEHADADNCVLFANPLHLELLEVCEMAGVDFILNVVLNDRRELCGVFAGHYDKAHVAGVKFARNHHEIDIKETVEVVITSSAGYPLDKTYYQTVKGMCGAEKIVKTGGTIIIVSECSEGMGNDTFVKCLNDFKAIDGIDDYVRYLSVPAHFTPDQWQVEKMLQPLRKAEIMLVSGGLSPEELEITGATPMPSVEAALDKCRRIYGDNMKIAVIPEGPYVIPV